MRKLELFFKKKVQILNGVQVIRYQIFAFYLNLIFLFQETNKLEDAGGIDDPSFHE